MADYYLAIANRYPEATFAQVNHESDRRAVRDWTTRLAAG